MRIDPDSPRAKAKMRALDKLDDMLDYSNSPMKKSVSDKETELIGKRLVPTEVGEKEHDGAMASNPDKYGESQQLRDRSTDKMRSRGEDDEGYGDGPDDLDNDNDDHMSETDEDTGKYFKTIDMADDYGRKKDRRDEMKRAAADMDNGPVHNDLHGTAIKKGRRY